MRDAVRLVAWLVISIGGAVGLLSIDPAKPQEPPATTQAKENRKVGADTIDVPAAIQELRAANPEIIGIGNSMMFTRLGKTPEAMSELTGRRFHFLYKNGSDAPVWFLTLKNVIAASGVKPKAVFLFVRDNELTTPFFGEDAEESPYLLSLRGAEEPELDAFMGRQLASQDAGEQAEEWLEQWLSFPEWREVMTRRLTDIAMDLGGGGAPKKAQRFALSARFGLEHLRGDVASDIPLPGELNAMTSDYKASIESSLLPSMLRLCEQMGARLIVFRVKRRPHEQTHLPEEPAAMREYAIFMKQWLEARGGAFFDETYDLSIHLTDYLDGDHIRPDRLKWYQDYFWQRTGGLFP